MNKTKEALKLALEEIKRVKAICLREAGIGLCNEIVIAQLEEALAEQPAKQQEPVAVLPDGSAFGVMSYPLPKDHWLYAERQYNDGEYEPVELGKPILTHELRGAVVSAVRYAIRGATNCGKEVDFDPDALVQNAVYALCGPYTSPPASKPLTPLLFSRRKAIADKLGVPMDATFNAIVRKVEAAHGITIEAAHGIKGDA